MTFVNDTSKYWYKRNINREAAVDFLKDARPGSFIVRNSNSFKGAFGLAIKVSPENLPPGTPVGAELKSTDLVRHFLIESVLKGVRLKGCKDEPIFGSLAAFVYQHSITPLALPVKLVLPEIPANERSAISPPTSTISMLYLDSIETELLTGPKAVARALRLALEKNSLPETTLVQMTSESDPQRGCASITLTDVDRKKFFRKNFPISSVTYVGLDPDNKRYTSMEYDPYKVTNARIFGIVVRKSQQGEENVCHLFTEFDIEHNADTIVSYLRHKKNGNDLPASKEVLVA